MPSANKYIIDVANIKPGGNSIKGLWVGNSESKYAMLGNTCIYDKVLYELEVDDITGLEPDVTSVTFTKKVSKKTHGNGDVDELTITPTSGTIPINSGASEQTTTFTVYNCTGSTATGANVTVSVKQKADYVTGSTYIITGTPDSSTNFPVTGGTHTFTVSSKRRDYYKSGKQVDVSVQFKVKNINENLTLKHNGTVITTATTLSDTNVITVITNTNAHNWYSRNLAFDIYCIDSTSTTYNVSWGQDNDYADFVRTDVITDWGGDTGGTISGAGGTKTVSWWTTRYHIYKWRSDNSEYISSTDTEGTATLSATGGTLSRTTITCGQEVTITVGSTTSERTITISESIGGRTVSWTQEAGLRGPYYGLPQLDSVTLSCDDVPAAGGTVYPSWGGTVYQWRYYLNAAGEQVNGEYIVITPSVSWSESSVYASSLGTTEKERTFITTCTASFTGLGGAAPTTKSINVYQQANTKTEQITYSDLRDTCYFRNNYPSWTGETVTFTSAGTIHIGNVYNDSIILVVNAKMKKTTTISYTSGAGSTTTGETGCLGYANCSENWLLNANTSAPIDVGPVAGDIVIKANANPNTTQRTATIHTSFTWQGMTATKDLVVTQEAAPYVPPTPTGYSFTITNESNYDLHLAFTTTNGTFQQDFVGGTGEIVTVTSTTLPITVVEIAGSISPGSDHTKIVELYNNTGTITASFEISYNAWYGTGQITVNDTGANNITIIVS